jgi:hypothetical protein
MAEAFAFTLRTVRYGSSNFSAETIAYTAISALFFAYHFIVVNAVYNQVKHKNMQALPTTSKSGQDKVPEVLTVKVY